jgi:hypothetical protein
MTTKKEEETNCSQTKEHRSKLDLGEHIPGPGGHADAGDLGSDPPSTPWPSQSERHDLTALERVWCWCVCGHNRSKHLEHGGRVRCVFRFGTFDDVCGCDKFDARTRWG